MRRASAFGLGLAALTVALAGCSRPGGSLSETIGDPQAGSVIVTRQACGSCHEIPGRVQADGVAAPPLDHFAARSTIAGVLPNTAPDLVLWLKSPQTVLPGNAMPDMGLTQAQAQDVAAYLYSLR